MVMLRIKKVTTNVFFCFSIGGRLMYDFNCPEHRNGKDRDREKVLPRELIGQPGLVRTWFESNS